MTFKSALAFAIFAVAATIFSVEARANLLVNGGFDDTTGFVDQGNDTMTLAPGSTTMTGWTVITNSAAWIGPNNPFGVTGSTGSGYFLDLQGYSDSAPYAGVQQSLSTCATCGYQLTFYLGSDSGDGIQDSMTVTAAGQSQTFTSTNNGTQRNLWQQETFNFLATGPSTTISLAGNTVPNGIYIGLDTVDLEQTSGPVSSVPEPSTWAMMILGFAGVGFMAYRRKSGTLRVA
jgi:Protein of unknown function (DUF642)/PEP-CTERM motif